MRWTVWQKRTGCQNCGAKIPVPQTGLTMVCQYCGTESAVPDIEDRKRKQRQAEADKQAERQADQRSAPPSDRTGQPRPAPSGARGGGGRGFLGVLVVVGIIGAVLHFTGTLSRFTEPLIGDDGRARYHAAEAPLQKDGYIRVTREKTERAFSATKLYLDLQPGHRHALVLGSGQPLSRVTIRDPKGRRVLHKSTLRYHEALFFTPTLAGVYTAAVVLERPGRYTWALHRGEARAKGDPAELLGERRRRLRRRRGRRRRRPRRPRRRSRVTSSRAHKRAVKSAPRPAEPPSSTSPAPAPRPRVDDDIQRAIKAGEIEDVDNL